jgi:hypothetical protein
MDNERLKIWLGFAFGFAVLLVLGFLGVRVALGKVEEASSYGLLPIITSLSTLAGGFATWMTTAIMRTSPKPNTPDEIPTAEVTSIDRTK